MVCAPPGSPEGEVVQVALLTMLFPVPGVKVTEGVQVTPRGINVSAKATDPPDGAGNPLTPVTVATKVTELPKVDVVPPP